jgi:myo-inositol-1(or 4)-monophosphatase
MTHKEFAVDLAREAGEIMLAAFRNSSNTRTYKADDTPVTIADQAINDLVQDRIATAYPEHGFLGEEGGRPDGQKYVWVCDPIDGTRSFARGIPASVFSLALVYDGEPILGVVYHPFMDEMYIGSKGDGAFCNNLKISVSNVEQLSEKVIIAASPYKIHQEHSTHDLLMSCAGLDVCFYHYGSAAYNAVLVARGAVDASVYVYGCAWDMAAVDVIIREAGGAASSLSGDVQRYDRQIRGFMGSNGKIHDQLISLQGTKESADISVVK